MLQIHKWVNAESMLEKCLVGKLKADNQMLRNTLLRRSEFLVDVVGSKIRVVHYLYNARNTQLRRSEYMVDVVGSKIRVVDHDGFYLYCPVHHCLVIFFESFGT